MRAFAVLLLAAGGVWLVAKVFEDGKRGELWVIQLRGEHPGWGPRRLAYELASKAPTRFLSARSIYRIFVPRPLTRLPATRAGV